MTSAAHHFGVIAQVLQGLSKANAEIRVLLVDPTGTPGLKDAAKCLDLYVVSEAPYDQLFPRCTGIIHHGGAGTCGKAIRHGLPSIIIPIFLWTDQGLWAQRLERMNLAIHIDRRSSSLRQEVTSGCSFLISNYSLNALDAARKQIMQEANGASRAVDAMLQSFHTKQE